MKNKITLYSMILIIAETICMFIPFCFLRESCVYSNSIYGGTVVKDGVNIFGVSTGLGTALAVVLVIFMLLSFCALLFGLVKNDTKYAKYLYFVPLVSFVILLIYTVYVAAFAKKESDYSSIEWSLNWLIFVIITLHIFTGLLCMVLRFNLFERFTSKNFIREETIKKNEAVSNADELKKYKELLDTGVITQEEFDAKKKQILGL